MNSLPLSGLRDLVLRIRMELMVFSIATDANGHHDNQDQSHQQDGDSQYNDHPHAVEAVYSGRGSKEVAHIMG